MAPHAVGDDEVVGIRPFAVVGDVPMKEAAIRVEVQHVETVPVDVEQEEEEKHKKPSRNWIMGEEAFERRMPHHDGIRALWETKWKFPCTMSVYPFHDGKFEDFEPVFQHLVENNVNDGTSPAYTKAFLPAAEALALRADSLLAAAAAHGRGADADSKAQASALYLRACALYRIARFPYITSSPAVNDPVKWHAWQLQKAAYAKAGKLWDEPLQEVHVPHRRRGNAAAAASSSIPVYVRVPRAAEDGAHPCPLVILMTGLDGYRPDNTARCDEFLARGWACCVAEVPGTADCPADPADPAAAERLWDDLLAWAGAVGVFDMARVMVWGLSSGGYYAVRIAHTHASRLAGVVAQGAGTHLFFDPGWLARADGHEYPFLLTPALAMKHGYDSVEEYVAGAQKKFSLLENGILDMPSTRLLLVNGTMDGLMPIEDSMLLFEHGSPKEARFFSGALHMGYPKANGSVYPWMESVMASVV